MRSRCGHKPLSCRGLVHMNRPPAFSFALLESPQPRSKFARCHAAHFCYSNHILLRRAECRICGLPPSRLMEVDHSVNNRISINSVDDIWRQAVQRSKGTRSRTTRSKATMRVLLTGANGHV